MALDVRAVVVRLAAVALVDPGLRHDLSRVMDVAVFLAHGSCVRQGRAARDPDVPYEVVRDPTAS